MEQSLATELVLVQPVDEFIISQNICILLLLAATDLHFKAAFSMKKISLSLLAWVGCAFLGFAHGPAHIHRTAAEEVDQALSEQTSSVNSPMPGTNSATQRTGKNFKETITPAPRKIWDATITTGWESRHIHYGVNETGNGGAWTSESQISIGGLGISAWNGFGLGNEFQEWDFSASYTLEAGPVFFIPGYNFRYAPGLVEQNHAHESGHEGELADEAEHAEEEAGVHAHGLYNNELFAILGTDAIPFVTPSTIFIWNLNENPGGYLAFRLDGELPVVKETFTLNPYALLSLNLGYNTSASYDWNNFEFGVQGNWRINKIVTAFAGVNYSVAMASLDAIGQGNEFWVNTGLSLAF